MTPTTKHIEEVVKEFEKRFSSKGYSAGDGRHSFPNFDGTTLKGEIANFLREKLASVVEARDRELESRVREMRPILYSEDATQHIKNIARYETLEEVLSLFSPQVKQEGETRHIHGHLMRNWTCVNCGAIEEDNDFKEGCPAAPQVESGCCVECAPDTRIYGWKCKNPDCPCHKK